MRGKNIPYGIMRFGRLPLLEAVKQNSTAMNKSKKIPDLKGRSFNGRPYPKIRCVREKPHKKIRQLLRSFVPMDELKIEEQDDGKT